MKPIGVINNRRALVLDPLSVKIKGRKRITKTKGKGRGVISTTQDLFITLAINIFNLTLQRAPKTNNNGNRGRKRALTLSILITLKRVYTPNPLVPLINPNINPITNKLQVLNQPNQQRTPPITILVTITTPLRTFTLPISPPKPNT